MNTVTERGLLRRLGPIFMIHDAFSSSGNIHNVYLQKPACQPTMTILEYSPSDDEILDFINDRIRELQSSDLEAKYILAGPEAYARMRRAIAARFKRSEGVFETYNYLPIVVDPSRSDSLCVLPAPAVCAESARLYKMKE